MFISKVTFKHGPELFDLLKRNRSSDGYIAHQILWSLFPNDGYQKRDFLFRRNEKSELPQFLLVSEAQPVESRGVIVESKPYEPQIKKGQKFSFSIVANPVVSRKSGTEQRSAKHDVWMDAKKRALANGADERSILQGCEDASKQWFIKQGLRCGFHINEREIMIDGYMRNRLYKKKRSVPIQYSSLQYQGLLTVTDDDLFVKSLFTGIGRSKAFGCGLMLIKRV